MGSEVRSVTGLHSAQAWGRRHANCSKKNVGRHVSCATRVFVSQSSEITQVQVKVAVMQWEEEWDKMMTELGVGANMPNLWRIQRQRSRTQQTDDDQVSSFRRLDGDVGIVSWRATEKSTPMQKAFAMRSIPLFVFRCRQQISFGIFFPRLWRLVARRSSCTRRQSGGALWVLPCQERPGSSCTPSGQSLRSGVRLLETCICLCR